MLAYMRTSLTLLIVSVALIKFIESLATVLIGIALIPVAAVVGWAGWRRYRRRRAMITRLYGQTPLTLDIAEPSRDQDRDRDHDRSGADGSSAPSGE